MTQTVVLITGANRGIGHGLLTLYLARPDHIVIAAVRNPGHPTSKALATLPKAAGTELIVVKIDATISTDPVEAVKTLSDKHNLNHIDILVANAGIALKWVKVSEVTAEDIQKHVDVNVYGFTRLFQAFVPVLQKAKQPKWVTIGSSAAFLTVSRPFVIFVPLMGSVADLVSQEMIPMKNAAYAPTKAVQHWLTKAIHIEEPWLIAFPIDPGWVQTDLGNRGADAFGYEKAAVTVDESVNGIIKVIDAATRETHSGKMWVYKGHESQW